MDESSLAGWTRKFAADGLIFTPRGGVQQGAIRVRTRVRPLVSAAAMIELLRGQVPALYTNVAVAKPRRVTTIDGDYAAIVQLTASVHDRSFQRTLAMIIGEEHFDSIDAVSTVPEEFEQTSQLVENLTSSYSLGLGERRRRRYYYRPPVGWAGLPRPRAALWLPPDFPANRASITVFDARPTTLAPSAVQDRALWEDISSSFQQEQRKPSFDMTNPNGVAGRCVIMNGRYPGGPREAIYDVALFDDAYVYFVRLESTEEHLEANRNALGIIVESVEPLPGARTASSLIRWAENWAE